MGFPFGDDGFVVDAVCCAAGPGAGVAGAYVAGGSVSCVAGACVASGSVSCVAGACAAGEETEASVSF